MIIENSEISYLRDKRHQRGAHSDEFPPAQGVVKLQKRHIYLHIFTFHALGYHEMGRYNTLVISDL